MELKIATLNLCLGLKNKRLDVENLLIGNDIQILREIKIESNFDFNFFFFYMLPLLVQGL